MAKAPKSSSKPTSLSKKPGKKLTSGATPKRAKLATSAGTIVAAGQPAPDWKLPSSTGNQLSLGDFRGKSVLLYFYPKADTPGCTKQACGLNAALAQIKRRGVLVLGISPDPESAVTKFAGKYSLQFPLLADADHAVANAYGVWAQKSMYGRSYWGVVRTSFLIDARGVVRKVFEKANPETHDADVLAWIDANPD